MPVTIGVPTETYPGERRVALVPRSCETLVKSGARIIIQSGAGMGAGIPDDHYTARGAAVALRPDVFAESDIIVQVRAYGANPGEGRADLDLVRPGQILIGFGEPLTNVAECAALSGRGVRFFAMELMPRITRAQAMDALSSMATIAGYRAVLIAAMELPKMFPMLMTAAGTVKPARVFILGAGVAGLQAIATAKRLGAVVSAYDVRPAVKEQVESVGAKFITLDVESVEGQGGYAKAMDDAFYQRQRELLTAVIREQDVLITTAAVPGRKAPILVTADMVRAMQPGSVIVDIAAERGGNCELTRPGETYSVGGVTIAGPLNIASSIPADASQMYASNVTALLKLLIPKGEIVVNMDDPIVSATLMNQAVAAR